MPLDPTIFPSDLSFALTLLHTYFGVLLALTDTDS